MHSCPNCGQACYCNGDIDDIEADPSAAIYCTHHLRCERDDDGEEEDACFLCGEKTDPFVIPHSSL